MIPFNPYLGNSKEGLGDLNNTGHLLDIVDARLDSAGVVGTGSVQNVLVLLDLTLGPLTVSRTTVLGDGSEDREQTEGGNGLLVHHVKLIADGGDRQTSGSGEDSSLGDERVSGDRVQQGLSLLSRVLGRNVRGRADRGQRRDSGADGESRPQASGAWRGKSVTGFIQLGD